MEKVSNIEQLVEWFESNNYYYRGQQFDSRIKFDEAAQSNYDYTTKPNDVVTYEAKRERFYIEENDSVVELVQYEAHAGDSGVPAEDYFYGYVINEL